MSKARADDLRNIPLQETDLLLHEAGAPPIHTPLDVLLKLPKEVKERLYVVHTQALPPGCELRVAPTGTAGTIRLDERDSRTGNTANRRNCFRESRNAIPEALSDDDMYMWSASEYASPTSIPDMSSSFTYHQMQPIGETPLIDCNQPPRVAMRPTSSTDAWFILNLLSAVPFLSSLSYSSTMEVLEIARVDAFCINDVVLPAARRNDVLCVIWEGTCMERGQSTSVQRSNVRTGTRRSSTYEVDFGQHSPMTPKDDKKEKTVWFAGDWTSPRILQPDKVMSGESSLSKTHDIVAMSEEGVKVCLRYKY